MTILELARSDLAWILADILFFFTLCALLVHKNNYIIYSFFIFLILAFKLVVFVGLRPIDAGNDTLPYFYAFQALDGISTSRAVGTASYGNADPSNSIEYLYWPFAAIVKQYISESFSFFLVLSITISAYLTYTGNKILLASQEQYKWQKHLAYSLIFTYFVFISYEIAYFGGHIRSAIGLPLAFISYLYSVNRNYKTSLIIFLISIGFHNSSISIAPLIALQIFLPDLKQSKKTTFLLVVTFASMLLVGQAIGLAPALDIFSQYYSNRYQAYASTEFNITSVFKTGYFYIIALHVIAFILIGYQKIHFYTFYYFSLILLFSATPKISERYFAYILICLPLLLYFSLRNRFNNQASILIVCLCSMITSILVISTYGTISTLSIYSFLTN